MVEGAPQSGPSDPAPTGPEPIEPVVVAALVAIARDAGFEAVRLTALADRTGIPLALIAARFRDVDAVANAWFKMARQRIMAIPFERIGAHAADERLARVMESWLAFFGADRKVALEIIRAKLHPSHAHHWVPLVFDLSRLVHDFLDVARVPGRGVLRAAQEMALTLITLAMLKDWAGDQSPDAATTGRRLRRRLGCVGCLAKRLPARR